jgi:glycosyltransferase involved in cell wall biosynthesis
MKNKKIVIFTPTLNIGGIERVLLTYAQGLGKKGYEIIYLTCSGKGNFQKEQFVNVQFVNLGVSRLRQSLWSLICFFKKSKPDIIITANDATLIIYLAKLLSRSSAKLITSHHNYYNNNSDAGIRHKFIIKYIYPLCNNVIAVSSGISLMLIKQFKLKEDKVTTIYNPVDINHIIHLSKEETSIFNDYILYVGRLRKVKNLPLLLNAFKIFNQNHSNIELLIIGDGDIKEDLQKLILELELQNVVHLIGIRSNPFPYIKNAKIVVLPSLSEALPTILIESLVLGKTIVATPTLGAIDILKNGDYGYLSESLNNVDRFAEMLDIAYDQPIDVDVLTNIATQNYNLDLKISEIEKLWRIN